MSAITRGARSVFRNSIRTSGVTIILGLSIGLALVMLLALKTVQSRINSVKSSIDNTVSISPAGFSAFSTANNALSTTDLDKVSSLPHVTNVTQTLTGRLTTIGSTTPSFGNQTQNSSATTSLTSPVKLNTNGGSGSGSGGGGRVFFEGGGTLPANFSLPISIVGTNNPLSLNGTSLSITSGATIDGSKDTDNALISADMASKNNLKVGQTFTAYATKLTVAGIFSSSSQGASNNVIVALPTEQRLSGQAGDVTSATATIDSVDNLSSATTAIKNTLGSSADVENSQQQVNSAIQPLENIKTISTYSLIGALVAGGIIIFLTMLMIVRERRREIGVLKAIGASNYKIVVQFVSEALTLTLFGAVLGMVAGLALSNPILKMLVTSSTTTTTTTGGAGGSRGGGGFAGAAGAAGRGFARALGGGGRDLANLHAAVGYDLLLYGLAAAFVIAVIGSALPAWLIARVRPAEVLRGE